ncbi:MAG: hypothetical protein WCG74_12545 [Sediminibacterium sp.]
MKGTLITISLLCIPLVWFAQHPPYTDEQLLHGSKQKSSIKPSTSNKPDTKSDESSQIKSYCEYDSFGSKYELNLK